MYDHGQNKCLHSDDCPCAQEGERLGHQLQLQGCPHQHRMQNHPVQPDLHGHVTRNPNDKLIDISVPRMKWILPMLQEPDIMSADLQTHLYKHVG